MLWGDLMIMFNQGDTADFWDTQQNWKLISWKLHSSSGVHTIMTSTGLVFHMLVESKYPLTKEVLSQMLELKLETEEESSMALELIKFVRQQLEEFEDSNDDDTVTSTHEDEERICCQLAGSLQLHWPVPLWKWNRQEPSYSISRLYYVPLRRSFTYACIRDQALRITCSKYLSSLEDLSTDL
ncbi:hypothetical protein Tco_0856402 [Tanacetum coccineum]|uniref:Uncharacterized protein n=1 Tax=Tanacetum coccineum TaxID=301880 RepID=A0ABQ5B379_9ASTR